MLPLISWQYQLPVTEMKPPKFFTSSGSTEGPHALLESPGILQALHKQAEQEVQDSLSVLAAFWFAQASLQAVLVGQRLAEMHLCTLSLAHLCVEPCSLHHVEEVFTTSERS